MIWFVYIILYFIDLSTPRRIPLDCQFIPANIYFPATNTFPPICQCVQKVAAS